MKLSKLVVEDFGPYRGRNEIDLSTTPDSPIVLFGGQNGAGKTTLFEAIRFCLHGRSALGRRVAMNEYHQTIRGRLHEYPDGPAEEASVRLEFEYAHLGEVDHYAVERRWRDRGKSIAEELEMRRNGSVPSELDHDQWQDFLQQLVPPGVAQLFFFDGEKIQELAAAVESDDSFTDSMESLLGLDLIERLDADLSIYVSRKLDESGVDGVNEEVEELQAEKQELELTLEDLTERQEAKEDELAELEDQIQEIEAEIASEGGSYAEQREELKERRAELSTSIEQLEEQIEELVTGVYPFALAPDLCRSVVDRLQRETEEQNRATAKEELTDELDDVLGDGEIWDDVELDGADVDTVASRIRDKLQTRFDDDAEPQLAHQFSRSQRQDIYTVVDRALNDVPDEFAVIHSEIEANVRELQEVESRLGKAPDEDVLSPMYEDLQELTEEKGSIKQELADLEEQISTTQTKLDRVSSQIQSKLEEKSRRNDVSDRANLASDVRNAVQDFRDELAREKLQRLESVLSEYYITLSNKSGFYDKVKIDQETLDITIQTRHGTQKSHSELSAGERQIFATSLLWALAEISGRPLPFIIDTPLGRLDQDHRKNLITNFFPEAADQVLIFSTDTEIDDEQYEELAGSISQSYQLEYDESTGATVPVEGYFWSEPTDQTDLEEVPS